MRGVVSSFLLVEWERVSELILIYRYKWVCGRRWMGSSHWSCEYLFFFSKFFRVKFALIRCRVLSGAVFFRKGGPLFQRCVDSQAPPRAVHPSIHPFLCSALPNIR